MIKRIIFDIDNTLIPWKDEYWSEIKNELDGQNILYNEQDYNKVIEAISEYENKYYTFDRKLMGQFINEYTLKNYPDKFIYNITNRWAECCNNEQKEEKIKVLEYLKFKYEMVILTDWFADQQIARLKKAGFLKYFEYVYAAEKTKRKPFKEAFMQAIGDNKPEECIMIGDSYERDIKGAINAGLKAIWYNPTQKQPEDDYKNKIYANISKLEELEEIL